MFFQRLGQKDTNTSTFVVKIILSVKNAMKLPDLKSSVGQSDGQATKCGESVH